MIKEILSSLIAGAFAIPLGILFIRIYQESKARKERKERLYYCRERLHKVALQFRDDCVAETQKVIVQYTSVLDWKSYWRTPDYTTYAFLSEYRDKIEFLKTDYLVNYAKKYSDGDEWLRMEAEDFFASSVYFEYKAELSEIDKIFQDIYDCMREQIEERKNKSK